MKFTNAATLFLVLFPAIGSVAAQRRNKGNKGNNNNNNNNNNTTTTTPTTNNNNNNTVRLALQFTPHSGLQALCQPGLHLMLMQPISFPGRWQSGLPQYANCSHLARKRSGSLELTPVVPQP
jgi:hypothetical protein